MCILFMYLNDKPDQCPYKLIVASNRDEYWDRPTEQAAFRGDGQQWIGGINKKIKLKIQGSANSLPTSKNGIRFFLAPPL